MIVKFIYQIFNFDAASSVYFAANFQLAKFINQVDNYLGHGTLFIGVANSNH